MSRVKQAVILAGGEGTRLRPLTTTRPKPLLPVLGVPCIEYVIRSLAEAGIQQVFLACGYRSEDIRRALGEGDRFGVEIEMAFEKEPMGTAGAVKLLEDRLEGTFVVGSGDTLTDADLGDLIDFHVRKGAEATMGLTEVERPEQFGIVGVSPEGRIERFKEKPRTEEVFSRVINAGTYVLEPDVLRMIPPATKYDFSRNLYMDMLEKGRGLYAEPLKGYWKDIGRPSDLFLANIDMVIRKGVETRKGKLVGVAPYGASIKGSNYFGENIRGFNCTIKNSAIGSRCKLYQRTRLENCLLLERTVIEESAHLFECILGESCHVGEGAVLKSCVLGDGAKIAPGSTAEGIHIGSGDSI
ncbi:MAG: sugar phosphate nucleotidyltransferase [Methanomassiliicoccales archaeon]